MRSASHACGTRLHSNALMFVQLQLQYGYGDGTERRV
jgi:hypothetical protein